MRKSIFITLAGLALVSCVNQETVVDDPTTVLNQGEIGFNMRASNMTRAGGATNLENEYLQFGVYAIKATEQSDIKYFEEGTEVETVVMDDYMVGYWNGTKGYEPKADQNLNGTQWYYEGLGKTETTSYTWTPGNGDHDQKQAVTSNNDKQYLKYWDLGKKYTYFYGYEPYGAAKLSLDGSNNTVLTFSEIEVNAKNQNDVMYAATRCENAQYINAKNVDMRFKRINSSVRLAFYSTIPGYTVYLTDFVPNTEDENLKGIIALPSKPKTDGSGKYEEGKFLVKGTPVVTFSDNAETIEGATFTALAGTVDYEEPQEGDYSSEAIVCPVEWFWSKDGYADADIIFDGKMGKEYTSRIYGPLYKVLPSQTNDGMTVNMSFKLVSDDTGEVLYVKGAKVYIDPEFTQWDANKMYTYLFRITHKVPGTTGDDPEPGVDPTPDPALYPIVFDNLTISGYEDGWNSENEWDVNTEEETIENPHDPEVHN